MNDDLVPYRRGMDYGIGLDSPSGDSRNCGVLGEIVAIPHAAGSYVSFNLTQISSDEDLQTSLGISASASGGVGLFSASASMEFAKKCHIHSHSVFLLACVDVNLAFSQIKTPKIAPEAGEKLADGKTARFQEMYGDLFVRGMQTGGRFFAVAEVFTSSQTEQESLSLSLKGSYATFSGKGSFSSEFSRAIENKSLKITVYHEGGVVPKEPTSLEDVQNIAATFAATVQGNAVPYAVLLDKYTILDLPNPPNYIDLQNQKDVLAFCAEKRNNIWTELNNVDYILKNSVQFEMAHGEYDTALLVAYQQALLVDLTAVTKAASYAIDHPRDAAFPTLKAQAPEFPKRKQGLVLVPNFVKMTWDEASLLSKQTGILITDYQPSGPDDPHETTDPRVLQGGYLEQDGTLAPIHTNDQIIVIDQIERAGSFYKTNTEVQLCWGLKPGIK